MSNFLIISYLRVFKISCSAELSMKFFFITSTPGHTEFVLSFAGEDLVS